MKSLQLAYKKKTSKSNPQIWKHERLCLHYTKFNLKWVVDPQGLKPHAFCEGGWRSVQSLDLRTVETTFIPSLFQPSELHKIHCRRQVGVLDIGDNRSMAFWKNTHLPIL